LELPRIARAVAVRGRQCDLHHTAGRHLPALEHKRAAFLILTKGLTRGATASKAIALQ
jgi:hypothetical protein